MRHMYTGIYTYTVHGKARLDRYLKHAKQSSTLYNILHHLYIKQHNRIDY